jgi:hypothetical protein
VYSTSGTDMDSVPSYLLDPIQLLVAEDFGEAGVDAFNSPEGLPVTGLGDLAVGLDYEIFANGLAPTLDPDLTTALSTIPSPAGDALFVLFFPEDLLGIFLAAAA